jgi:hypothetical protein
MEGFGTLDVEEFVHTKIDINAVKVGVKVAVDVKGQIELVWSKNMDFSAFISEPEKLGILEVPDLRLTTHPANSILRVLTKANAMGLAFTLPSCAELEELAADGVLCRMMLMDYHMAAFEVLPDKLKLELKDLGLQFVPAKSDDTQSAEKLIQMRFIRPTASQAPSHRPAGS